MTLCYMAGYANKIVLDFRGSRVEVAFDGLEEFRRLKVLIYLGLEQAGEAMQKEICEAYPDPRD